MEWIILIIVFIFIVYLISKASKNNTDTQERRAKIEESIRNNDRISILNSKSENTPAKIFIENNRFADDESKLTGSFNVAIKGLYYRSSSELKRAKKIELMEELFLEKEYGNIMDKFAVKVKTWDGYFIGYIDACRSEYVTKMIDNGYKINCFLSKSTYNDIPYQYMDIYYLGKNPKYKPPKNTNIVYVDYEKRIEKLKENIKNSTISANNSTRDTVRNNALKRIEDYKAELSDLENIKHENEK